LKRTKHQVRNEAHADYIHWLHGEPCAACGYIGEAIQAAHVGQGGTGLKHGDDDQAIPLCGPHDVYDEYGVDLVVGCHVQHDQCLGQFRLMNRAQRRVWDADQVAIHRARFESRNENKRSVPF
jgi:hypothetical protein